MWFLPRSPSNRLALLAPLLLLASCRINGVGEDEIFFKVEADSSLVAYSRVVVLLSDSAGGILDTLFDDSLTSPADLEKLPAGPYRGGPARITVLGFKDGELVHGETRVYDGDSQQTLALLTATLDTTSQPSGPIIVPVAHAPGLDSFSRDTTVSIRDSVSLGAKISDPDGDLAGYAWDCGLAAGGGTTLDTQALGGSRAKVAAKRAFPDSGNHACLLKVWDRAGHRLEARVGIRVEWDAPTANAGKDTTVVAGTLIRLHAKADDRFGPIVSREWKIGSGPFVKSPQQETTQRAPEFPGDVHFVLRVTDTDGLTAEDSLIVTVISASPI